MRHIPITRIVILHIDPATDFAWAWRMAQVHLVRPVDVQGGRQVTAVNIDAVTVPEWEAQ
jgi:hypothetical protein